jgi:hypothetical protein
MMKLLLFLLMLTVQGSWAQTTMADSTKYLIRDTTLLIAKEYCQNSTTTCWFGDDVHLNRMLIYNGPFFWKNYPSMLFYFTGLDLRNYQEKNNINYDYLQKVEDLLNEDIKNDSNRIFLLNRRRKLKNSKRIDTVQYKLYKVKCAFVYAKKTTAFVPNFFKPRLSASYIDYPSNIYYITKIESISPYNALRSKDKIIKVNGK